VNYRGEVVAASLLLQKLGLNWKMLKSSRITY
jgi:hypothetical protein